MLQLLLLPFFFPNPLSPTPPSPTPPSTTPPSTIEDDEDRRRKIAAEALLDLSHVVVPRVDQTRQKYLLKKHNFTSGGHNRKGPQRRNQRDVQNRISNTCAFLISNVFSYFQLDIPLGMREEIERAPYIDHTLFLRKYLSEANASDDIKKVVELSIEESEKKCFSSDVLQAIEKHIDEYYSVPDPSGKVKSSDAKRAFRGRMMGHLRVVSMVVLFSFIANFSAPNKVDLTMYNVNLFESQNQVYKTKLSSAFNIVKEIVFKSL